MTCCRQTDRPPGAAVESVASENHTKMRRTPLLFTLKEASPVRLSAEDLHNPSEFQRRLKEWLLRQR